jgi:hypothetical protein
MCYSDVPSALIPQAARPCAERQWRIAKSAFPADFSPSPQAIRRSLSPSVDRTPVSLSLAPQSHNSSVWAGELHLPLQSPALLIRLTPVIAPSSLPFLRTAHGRRWSGRG